MKNCFLTGGVKELVFCVEEAINLSAGSPVIAGTFHPTRDAWTGFFETDDGQVYKIIDGHITEEGEVA